MCGAFPFWPPFGLFENKGTLGVSKADPHRSRRLWPRLDSVLHLGSSSSLLSMVCPSTSSCSSGRKSLFTDVELRFLFRIFWGCLFCSFAFGCPFVFSPSFIFGWFLCCFLMHLASQYLSFVLFSFYSIQVTIKKKSCDYNELNLMQFYFSWDIAYIVHAFTSY